MRSFRFFNVTTLTLILGVAVSFFVFGAVAYGVNLLLQVLLPPANFFGFAYLEPFIGLVVGGYIGYLVFSLPSFTVGLGKKASFNILRVPTFTLGVGRGWGKIHGLTSINEIEAAALRVDLPVHEFLTGDGQEVKADSAVIYEVEDAAATTMISGSTIPGFVESEALETLRSFIVSRLIDSKALYNKDATVEELYELRSRIAQFKTEIAGNGDYLVDELNKKLMRYGLRATAFPVENIKLAEAVEKASQELLTQALKAAGLTREARNTTTAAGALLEFYGDDFTGAHPAVRLEYRDRSIDRAMALDDNSKVIRITGDSSRVLVTTGETT